MSDSLQLFVAGDCGELAPHWKAELGPDAYALARAWANVVESETGAYFGGVEVRTVTIIARHFPSLKGAICGSPAT